MKRDPIRRLARAAGVLFGGVMPTLDTGELDENDPLHKAFKGGFADGKIARTVGEMLTAALQRDDEDEDETP